ncbi:hypothetical protein PDR5_43360 [Pseudomonas sp. DR 5-09]|nr:hypothetical protein PDR5_43360 [Pseudomonas sp. DR 5-09]
MEKVRPMPVLQPLIAQVSRSPKRASNKLNEWRNPSAVHLS